MKRFRHFLITFFILTITYDSYSQDPNYISKIILLTRINSIGMTVSSENKRMEIGDNVVIVVKNNTDSIHRGEIQSITDSTVILKNKTISISDISQIKKSKSGLLIAGGVLDIIGLTSLFASNGDIVNGAPELIVISIICIPIGVITTVAGLIVHAFNRTYDININWKISVINEIHKE